MKFCPPVSPENESSIVNTFKSVLVTGGAGYIGSHTTLALLQAGWDVVVLDNLCNASAESLRRVMQLAGRPPTFVQGDIRDRALLDQLLEQHPVQAVHRPCRRSATRCRRRTWWRWPA